MRIGVTGHQERDGIDWKWVRYEIGKSLAGIPNLIGYTSLAAGTDQLFGSSLLEHGGRLKAIIPIPDYLSYFEGLSLDNYKRLIEAAEVIELKSMKRDEQAFLDAGKWIVRHSDRMIAVWDGEDAEGTGGTGDIVAYARSLGKPIIHLDPIRRSVASI